MLIQFLMRDFICQITLLFMLEAMNGFDRKNVCIQKPKEKERDLRN